MFILSFSNLATICDASFASITPLRTPYVFRRVSPNMSYMLVHQTAFEGCDAKMIQDLCRKFSL